ncbi:MAG: hypothetical protein M5F18_00750 [Asgard group archaeon]|nr:hypothetical protein [Asgard group archaeon]
MSGSGNELFNLVKNSRLSQVAQPLLKNMRAKSNIPTHQVIFTPKSSAARSNYGLKTTLPNKIGSSYISFNDIDNRQSMPDVEKNSGFYYKQLMFKELGLPVKTHYTGKNPLFPDELNKSDRPMRDGSLANTLNLPTKVQVSEIVKILKKNPEIYDQFNKFLIKNHPKILLTTVSNQEIIEILKEFLLSSPEVVKKRLSLTTQHKINPKFEQRQIQGTGGFSYNQKGRLRNTPNGIQYGTVVPGRIIDNKEAAIAGFVSSVTDRSIALQTNYAKNYPGKHHRQFTVPFKISEAELSEDGSVRLFAEGIKSGKWMETNDRFTPSRTNFAGSSERNKADGQSLESLLNLILPTK